MKRRSLFACIALLASVGVGTAAVAAEKIALGELNWTGSKVLTLVLKTVIEQNFPVTVDVVSSNNAVIYKSMDRGAGDIDVHTNVWMPAQASFTQQYVDEKKTVELTPPMYNAVTATCIPGYIQDEYGVKSVFDLNNPEIAKLFDNDGDGKGEWYPGPTGDQSTAVERVKGREYGLSNFFTEVNMDHAVFNGVLKDLYAKKKGVLFLCWTPHWIWKAFDLRILEEPESTPGCMDGMVYPHDDPDWFSKAKVACGWPKGTVNLAYSATLDQRAPQVAAFLNRVSMETAVVSGWINDVDADSKDAEAVAKAWVAENQDTVDRWLGLK